MKRSYRELFTAVGLVVLSVFSLSACGGVGPTSEGAPETLAANAAPEVSLEISTTDLKRGVRAVATVNGAPSGSLRYSWDFGDGTVKEGESESEHAYAISGSYTVTVSVSDAQESTSARQEVSVAHLRPEDAPDALVVGFAGRCGLEIVLVGCAAPDDNEGYLDDDDAQSVQAIAETLEDLGYSVSWLNGRAHLESKADSDSLGMGYKDIADFMEFAKTSWISDFDNPTRLVLVGHSHGAVWASLLAWNFPELTFDYAVYLDGICRLWWDDQKPYFVREFDRAGERRPFPLDENRVLGPCKALRVPGRLRQDIEDVTPDNVVIGLEVQAGTFVPRDLEPNRRQSGDTSDLYTIVSKDPHFGSRAVYVRGRESMNWVTQSIATLGLSGSDLSTMSTLDLRERVPAPEGFEYAD